MARPYNEDLIESSPEAMIKRNDIVYSKHDADRGGYFYGRVTRILPDGMVETVDCGRYIRVQRPDNLIVANEYKGYWDSPLKDSHKRFISMPSLRRLKQMAARYDKTVWKHRRGGYLYCERTQFMEPCVTATAST